MKKKKPKSKKTAPKKPKSSAGHKLFNTPEGIKELFKYELDKYYISMGGNIVSFDDKGIFSRKKVEEYHEEVILSICQVISMPKSHEEREEAIFGLITLTILPFKVH
jgi:hypothetical protein